MMSLLILINLSKFWMTRLSWTIQYVLHIRKSLWICLLTMLLSMCRVSAITVADLPIGAFIKADLYSRSPLHLSCSHSAWFLCTSSGIKLTCLYGAVQKYLSGVPIQFDLGNKSKARRCLSFWLFYDWRIFNPLDVLKIHSLVCKPCPLHSTHDHTMKLSLFGAFSVMVVPVN